MSATASFRVIAPYRFNPLGAHIDHQGGAVLARTLDRHTALEARAVATPSLRLRARLDEGERAFDARFDSAVDPSRERWERYALGAARVLHDRHGIRQGIDGQVAGSMIAAGLSSSASFILAILVALAEANRLELERSELVDCVREVEHEHLGLTNGIQDQLSIVHGRARSIARLEMDSASATHVDDPASAADVRWLLCFSGVSRELVGSGFNTRVAECVDAAGRLHAGARRLGDVPPEARDLSRLPDVLARRATHVYGEMQRVEQGIAAWHDGDVDAFGRLMNASCRSSIDSYESGSAWLVALHEIALDTPGVFGNRFSGGGYGGCLVMLADAARIDTISNALIERYTARYPKMLDKAFCFVAGDADGVIVEREA